MGKKQEQVLIYIQQPC